jgi:hypothetical protein
VFAEPLPNKGGLYTEIGPRTHWIGGWEDPRAGLNAVKILAMPGIEPEPSSMQPVAVPTELSRLLSIYVEWHNITSRYYITTMYVIRLHVFFKLSLTTHRLHLHGL